MFDNFRILTPGNREVSLLTHFKSSFDFIMDVFHIETFFGGVSGEMCERNIKATSNV